MQIANLTSPVPHYQNSVQVVMQYPQRYHAYSQQFLLSESRGEIENNPTAITKLIKRMQWDEHPHL